MGRRRPLCLFQLEERAPKGLEAGLARHGAVSARKGRGAGTDLRGIHARDPRARALPLKRGYRADRRNQTQARAMTAYGRRISTGTGLEGIWLCSAKLSYRLYFSKIHLIALRT